MYTSQLLIGFLVIINIVALIITAYDKRKSVVGNHTERTPEGQIFFLASIFGATGVFVAMQLFRHKTIKWYFQLGIPLLIVQNVATVYVVWNLLL